jgi:hypothetical protein
VDARIDADGEIEEAAPLEPGPCVRHLFTAPDLVVFETTLGSRAEGRTLALDSPLSFAGIVTAHGAGCPSFDAPYRAEVVGAADDYRFVRIAQDARVLTIVPRGMPDFGLREREQVASGSHRGRARCALEPIRARSAGTE